MKTRGNFILTILLLIAVTANYCSSCKSTVVVDGSSMYPTLHDGDLIYTSSLLPRIHTIQRGDIVGITTIVDNTTIHIIKRVIGLPNERVSLKDGIITVNGETLNEPYISDEIDTEGEFDYQLHDNQYIVLGDNRPDSRDSRDSKIGIVRKKEIDFIYLKVKTSTNDLA